MRPGFQPKLNAECIFSTGKFYLKFLNNQQGIPYIYSWAKTILAFNQDYQMHVWSSESNKISYTGQIIPLNLPTKMNVKVNFIFYHPTVRLGITTRLKQSYRCNYNNWN